MAEKYKVYAYKDYIRYGKAVLAATEDEAKKIANEMIAGKRGYLPNIVIISASEDKELLWAKRTALENGSWSEWETL